MPPNYHTAIVHSNKDPDKRGRLLLEIPGMLDAPVGGGDAVWPDWIEPRLPAGSGPGAAGLFWIPPDQAIVVVETDGERVPLRWLGSTLGQVNSLPPFLVENYPRRAGWSSVGGSHVIALDEDSGAHVVASGGAGDTVLTINPNGTITGTTPNGGAFVFDGSGAQITGAAVELGAGLTPPLDRYLLTTANFPDWVAWLAALDAFMIATAAAVTAPQVAAAAVAFIASQPTGTFGGKHTTSLATGAPYLSTIIKGQ